MKYLLLENCMNDLAVIRTTFETLDLFSANDPVSDLCRNRPDVLRHQSAGLTSYAICVDYYVDCVLKTLSCSLVRCYQ
jgi:hypothetical protein